MTPGIWDELRAALQARRRRDFPFERLRPEHVPPGGLARGAVLVPLFEKEGGIHVLLTRRGRDLRHHAGQLSFPGGRIEPGEDALAAALREAQEEVGLDPAVVDVLGRLDETLVLASAFRLTPWVGRIPHPCALAPDPDEVDEILEVPLAALVAPGAHRTEEHQVYGIRHVVHFYEAGGETVWGATARILHRLLATMRR